MGCHRGRFERGELPMHVTVLMQPLIALVFGILILLLPRILNYLVAIYLILLGVTGLFPHLIERYLG
jgi:Protein of unknown function (DUF3096)